MRTEKKKDSSSRLQKRTGSVFARVGFVKKKRRHHPHLILFLTLLQCFSKLLFSSSFSPKRLFLQRGRKKIKNTQTDHASLNHPLSLSLSLTASPSLRLRVFLRVEVPTTDDDDDVHFVLRDARSNEREFSEI